MEREWVMASKTGRGDLYVKQWLPEGDILCAMQLTHGMAEHIARYDAFAKALNAHGVLVTGLDLPGHGKSIGENGAAGYFADENGWDKVITDMRALHLKTRADYGNVPHVLFGHSMGSFLSRAYAARHGEDFDAYVFCGTAGANGAVPIAKLLAKAEIKKYGALKVSARLNALSFGAYNKPFKPARTEFDWLSRDEAEVDKYVADEHCGFVFTAGGYLELFKGLAEIQDKGWAARVAKKPILLLAGGSDPVGANGKGVKAVEALLKKTGHDVTTRIYEGYRHEVLNELGRERVYEDVLSFIKEKVLACGTNGESSIQS